MARTSNIEAAAYTEKTPRLTHISTNFGSTYVLFLYKLTIGIWPHPRNWPIARLNTLPCNRALHLDLGPLDISWDRGRKRFDDWVKANPDFHF